ncbi:hypothetical protein SM139_3526, partial [Stenotrophomonas maltophilia]
MTASAN